MKLKVTALLLICMGIGIFYFTGNNTARPIAQKTTQQSPSKVTLPSQSSSYFVTIESAVLSQNSTPVTHSSLNWNMHFNGTGEQQGLLTDIEFSNNAKPQTLVKELPFKFTENNGVFSHVDLLALPSDHTLNVLPNILDLLSFSEASPLTFNDAHGQKTYTYQRINNEVQRQITSHLNKPITTKSDTSEQWHLTLNTNQQPLHLNYSSDSIWHNKDQQYHIIQKVDIQRLTPQDRTFTNVSSNKNAALASQKKQIDAQTINDETSMYVAIAELQTTLDPTLAKLIGEFLLQEYDLTELITLIEQDSSLSSAIIYALQKEQSPLAEQMLADLLTTDRLTTHIKQKLLIALGRFGASSTVSFNALATLADKPNNPLAKTALLNLGSMAKFTPEQSSTVEHYLSEQLKSEQHLSTAILASANSKNTALLPHIAKLLNHQQKGVKRDAVKVLSSKAQYHDQVVATIIDNPDVQIVDAFARAISDSGLVLSQYNKARLQTLYNTTQNPIILKRLKTLGIKST